MIAHINNSGEKQSVKDHLKRTAELAKMFAEEFDCGEIAYYCGILHDIGKCSDEFQKRICDPEHVKKVDHSTAGALEAMKEGNIPVAMAAAGHHSGLMDGGNYNLSMEGDGTFFGRIKKQVPNYSKWKEDITFKNVPLPLFCSKGTKFTMSFFIRMLYSCLVDADYLDTERFMNGGKENRGNYFSINRMCSSFDNYINGWLHKTDFTCKDQEELCKRRNFILKNCLEKGKKLNRGLYTLTVPTGGGKTTASLGFALKHMQNNDMRRVIYVIPYTSIIDQNAEVFRDILGDENVLEHHSGILYERTEDQAENFDTYQKALATENWDMPVIVTTAVQFFESLFASKSSKCRKLHNIANSVIIFDEAQTLPMPYLEPCIAAIFELVQNYKSTVILCTATQPALDGIFRKYGFHGEIQEICDSVEELYQKFKRTKISNSGVLSFLELSQKIKEKEQVLCIVNKRKTAQKLYANVNKEGTYCLTTLLYPAGRKQQIQEIRYRLDKGMPCRVIATSLVEAGVDLDFPEVYRQETGLDSLIQAAGRCNREGKRKVEDSNVYLYKIDGENNSFNSQNVDALFETLRFYEDPTDLKAITHYFMLYRDLLGKENLDQKKIMDAWERGIDGRLFPFSTVSEKFHLIETQTNTIYIPVDEGESLIGKIYDGQMNRELLRKLGQYSVNIFPDHFERLKEYGCLEMVSNAIYVLRDMNQYRKDTGLQMDVETGFGFYI